MTDPAPTGVALDPVALRSLAGRVCAAGDELSETVIPAIPAQAGCALAAAGGPGLATAELRRIGTAVQEWATAALRTAELLTAADDANAGHLSR